MITSLLSEFTRASKYTSPGGGIIEDAGTRPDTINKLRFAVDAAFAMLAGMQLDVFTPLKDGPKTVDQIAEAIGIRPNRLGMLLYALVSAGLLVVKDGFFANTPETSAWDC